MEKKNRSYVPGGTTGKKDRYCAICGKLICTDLYDDYAYKLKKSNKNYDFFCGWSHFRKAQTGGKYESKKFIRYNQGRG